MKLFKEKETKHYQSSKDSISLKTTQKSLPSATNLIVSLRESDFFNKPKTLAEIKEALDQQGSFYPITTLSGVALELVRKRLLGRLKQNNIWAYVKR